MVKYEIKKIDATGIYKVRLAAHQIRPNGEGNSAKSIVKNLNEKYKLKKHE